MGFQLGRLHPPKMAVLGSHQRFALNLHCIYLLDQCPILLLQGVHLLGQRLEALVEGLAHLVVDEGNYLAYGLVDFGVDEVHVPVDAAVDRLYAL